jgi:tetratricopeptide (TPR) repeat protein
MVDPTAYPRSSGKQSLAELMKSLEAGENPERELLRRMIEQTRMRDPQLAEAIRFCAIPHRFDARVIGVLRNDQTDSDENRRLLAALRDYEFVMHHRDGGYVYHDATREILLQDWQSPYEDRLMFDEYNRRLAVCFDAQRLQVQKDAQDLADVSALVHGASQNRYTQLALILEKQIIGPILEALYHKTLQSAELGHILFQRYFDIHDTAGQLTICELLLNAMRSYMQQLPAGSGQEKWLKWLRFYEGRLALRRHRFAEAEIILREAQFGAEDDLSLKFQILGELWHVFSGQYKMQEAQNALDVQLTLAPEIGVDEANISMMNFRLGAGYLMVFRVEDAVQKFLAALESSEKAHNPRLTIHCLLILAKALQEYGQLEQAVSLMMDALHYSRLEFRQDKDLQHAVIMQWMELLSRDEAVLLETLFYEARVLLPVVANISQQQLLLKEYAVFLIDGGQDLRAEQILQGLLEHSSDDQNPFFKTEILSQIAGLQELKGAYTEAIDLRTQTIRRGESGQSDPLKHAFEIVTRGSDYLECGKWQEALADFRTAESQFEEAGSPGAVALVRVAQANALRKQGHLLEAQQILDEIRTSLLELKSATLSGLYYGVQGDTYADMARWPEAFEQYNNSFSSFYSMHRYKELAPRLSDLSQVSMRQGQWTTAAQYSDLASKVCNRLAEFQRYSPDATTQQADESNARGMLFFSMQESDAQDNLTQALDAVQSALAKAPKNFWYQLNLAYIYAALKHWDAAARAAEAALDNAAEWVRPLIYRLILDCRIEEIETLLDGGLYGQAHQSATAACARLDGSLLATQIARLRLREGDSLFLLGRINDAQQVYKSVLTQVPSTDQPASQSAVLFTDRLDFVEKTLEGGRMERLKRKLSADLPEGWFAKESITLLARDGQANIIASSEPLDESMDTHRYAEIQGDLLKKEFPGYKEYVFESAEIFGGNQGYVRRFEWTPPEGVPVTQVQLYYVENGRGFTATATTPSSQYERFELQLRLILNRMVINED